MKKNIYTFLILFLLSGRAAAAPKPIFDGSYYDWNVYMINDITGDTKCYIASFPTKTIGNYKKERKPYIMITNFKKKRTEEISVYGDFEYKLNAAIFMALDAKQFRLFTKGKMAWAKTSADDKEIIESIINTKSIKIRSESSTGEYTVDYYSIEGLARAYKRMKFLCQ